MRYSIIKKIQDDQHGGNKWEGAELGVQDAESIEQILEALDKLVAQYEQSLEETQSGKVYSKRKKDKLDEAIDKVEEDKVNLKDIPF